MVAGARLELRGSSFNVEFAAEAPPNRCLRTLAVRQLREKDENFATKA